MSSNTEPHARSRCSSVIMIRSFSRNTTICSLQRKHLISSLAMELFISSLPHMGQHTLSFLALSLTSGNSVTFIFTLYPSIIITHPRIRLSYFKRERVLIFSHKNPTKILQKSHKNLTKIPRHVASPQYSSITFHRRMPKRTIASFFFR